MTLKDLTALLTKSDDANITSVIAKLQSSRTPPDLVDYKKQFDPKGHDSVDIQKRPDKQIQKPDPADPTKTTNGIAKVNRLSLSLQKIITSRAVSFLFGNPVKLVSLAGTEGEKKVVDALTRILYDNKIDSFNRRTARDMFRSTEIAECWFPVEKEENHDDYGFPAKFKIRVTLFSPWEGNQLYPLFDETGDLIAFSRAYTRRDDDNKEIKCFETYTDQEIIKWEQLGSGWSEVSRTPNQIRKIPVVYGKQEQVEWADVQTAIDRLEYLLSNFADTNDYHAAPKIFVQGGIKGFAQKGESGAILEGNNGATANYLSWDHATDAVKLEIETLLRFIYSFTQTPDISFDSVKGLREISGEALKMLFLDAHLKVQEKREVFDEYLQRRINILKAFIGEINISLKKDATTAKIEAEIQPFIINDVKALIDQLSEATGGKQILSQKTAVAQSGLVDDVDAEYKLIQEEQDRAAKQNILDPATIQ